VHHHPNQATAASPSTVAIKVHRQHKTATVATHPNPVMAATPRSQATTTNAARRPTQVPASPDTPALVHTVINPAPAGLRVQQTASAA